MNLAEKILAAHVVDSDGGQKPRREVHPGELVNVRVDVVMANDITAPIAIREFRRIGVDRVFDPSRVVFMPDHFTPNKDIKAAEECRAMRLFAREQEAVYYETGFAGIEHVVLPEDGLVGPGDVVVGGDSHTCTYGALGAFATGVGSTDIAAAMALGEIWMRVPASIRFVLYGTPRPWVGGKDYILYIIGKIGIDGATYRAMEFSGEAVQGLDMSGRLTMSNMAIEAGAKAGIFEVDDVTLEYVQGRAQRPFTVYQPDPDAAYERVYEIDVSEIEPQVAFPHLPSNTRPVGEAEAVTIDQSVIGSCTNGRIEDLRVAASVLRGRKVHPHVRLIVIPGSQKVYLEAVREGLVEALVEAGAAVSTPTCGPCIGGHMGVLAAGERSITTTNRNFRGRGGSPQSEIYLASPAVAAASAVLGRIGSPDEL